MMLNKFSSRFSRNFSKQHLSTVNHKLRYDSLLNQYYTNKVEACPLCHPKNRCKPSFFYTFNFYEGFVIKPQSPTHYFCLKTVCDKKN